MKDLTLEQTLNISGGDYIVRTEIIEFTGFSEACFAQYYGANKDHLLDEAWFQDLVSFCKPQNGTHFGVISVLTNVEVVSETSLPRGAV